MPDISGDDDDWQEATYYSATKPCGTCNGTGLLTGDGDASDIPGNTPELVLGKVLAIDASNNLVIVSLVAEIESGLTYWFTGMEAAPFQPGVLWVRGAQCSRAGSGIDVAFEVKYLPVVGAQLMQRNPAMES